MDSERDRRIRSAGVLQSVIASGAPVNEWVVRSKYGLRIVNYLTAGLGGVRLKAPKIPSALENDNGNN